MIPMTMARAACALCAACALILPLAGCSTGMLPNPEQIASTPLGTESIKLGMSKQQVESLWGKPDNIQSEENKDALRGKREIWFYGAHYSGIVPQINAGYLSNAKKLYFDGNNLVVIK